MLPRINKRHFSDSSFALADEDDRQSGNGGTIMEPQRVPLLGEAASEQPLELDEEYIFKEQRNRE